VRVGEDTVEAEGAVDEDDEAASGGEGKLRVEERESEEDAPYNLEQLECFPSESERDSPDTDGTAGVDCRAGGGGDAGDEGR
jgi:hypothetical protein